jgi:sensor domain CHASE-containing protein
MTIRTRTLLALGVTLATLVVALYAVLSSLLAEGFDSVETRVAERNMTRLREAFGNETETLCQKANDWAAWDDAYAFAEDHNPEFIAANIAPTTFSGMRLGFILVFDHAGRLVLGTAYDASRGTVAEASPRLLAEHFGMASPWVGHPNAGSVHSGLLLTTGLPPALFCSQPILTTQGHGPLRGALVFGRFFDAQARESLARVTRLDLAFAVEGEPAFSAELASALSRLTSPEAIDVQLASESQLLAFTRFEDAYGQRSIVARAMMARDIHAQARRTLRLVLVAFVLVGLGFAVVIMALMERFVLGRLARLNREVASISGAFDSSSRLVARGRDEIAGLATAINKLLAAAVEASSNGGEREALKRYLPVALAQLEVDLSQSGQVRDLVLCEMTDAFAAATGLRTDAIGRSLLESLALAPEQAGTWRTMVREALGGPGPRSFELVVGAQSPRVRATIVSIRRGRVMVHLATLPGPAIS